VKIIYKSKSCHLLQVTNAADRHKPNTAQLWRGVLHNTQLIITSQYALFAVNCCLFDESRDIFEANPNASTTAKGLFRWFPHHEVR